MSARVEASIPGNPGDARVNGWTRSIVVDGRVRVIEGAKYRAWKAGASTLLRSAARGVAFAEGPVRVQITAHWPRMTRQGAAAGIAFGDVDAVAKAVLDALEASGVIKADGQVVEVTLAKLYDATKPRIEIEVTRA